jgi:hypothetical protein
MLALRLEFAVTDALLATGSERRPRTQVVGAVISGEPSLGSSAVLRLPICHAMLSRREGGTIPRTEVGLDGKDEV